MYVTAPQMADLMPDARQLLSDEPEMESTRDYQQLALLVSSLEGYWQDRADFLSVPISPSTTPTSSCATGNFAVRISSWYAK